jgi:hypothetical protein
MIMVALFLAIVTGMGCYFFGYRAGYRDASRWTEYYRQQSKMWENTFFNFIRNRKPDDDEPDDDDGDTVDAVPYEEEEKEEPLKAMSAVAGRRLQ